MQKDTEFNDGQYFRYTENEIYNNLDTSEDGLTDKEAEKRLEKFGYNELEEKGKKSIFEMFFQQFTDVLTLVLLAAIIISLVLFFISTDQENLIDASVIFIILIVNAIIGVRQEYKSEKALEALQKLSAPEATVIRNEKMKKIPAREIVPGDYVVLQTGDKVVADMRLVKAMNLKIDESMLTGESVPVTKKDEVIDEKKVQVSERKNIAHSGTIVTYGGGEGVVFRTGMKTEMGKIADLIQGAEEKKTPLQKDLAKLSKWLTILIVIICVVVFVVGILRNYIDAAAHGETLGLADYEKMFLSAVSLAVAAIPEGLPAIVTIALSIGVSRMVEKNAIIRKLSAVETLGCATVICSDKTGTLTQNEMTIRKIYTDDKMISVSGIGYEPKGKFEIDGKEIEMKNDSHMRLLCRIGILCSDAELNYNNEENKWEIFGDPTEASLLVLGGKIDLWKKDLLKKYPKKNVIPFDSTRKMMTTIHETSEDKYYAYVKGAPEQILDRCIKKYVNETEKEISEDYKQKILKINENMTKQALRTLALAYREVDLDKVSTEEIDSE
ncbi:MAG: HAD-IC family P-type ATPase, partial [Candidatus Lokiarchaeota archaeon]|nr:HAD-IC family P-type ATPase [Candidatus Lokiarchaeota archaeon]